MHCNDNELAQLHIYIGCARTVFKCLLEIKTICFFFSLSRVGIIDPFLIVILPNSFKCSQNGLYSVTQYANAYIMITINYKFFQI